MLSEKDNFIVQDMITREENMKRRQNVIENMIHKRKVFKRRLLFYLTLSTTIILFIAFEHLIEYEKISLFRIMEVNFLIAIVLFVISLAFWQKLIKFYPLKAIVKGYDNRLRIKNAGTLLASKRWLQFYYSGKEISAQIPQILHYLQVNENLNSIDEALAYINEHTLPESDREIKIKMESFQKFVSKTNEMILSTANEDGQPSIRKMRFIVLDKANVWYFGTAPNTPKVSELDLHKAAIYTMPTAEGMAISSNRLKICKTEYNLNDLKEYYEEQVPGFMDSLSEKDRESELIYKIELQSVRLDSWTQHEEISFY
ncbi:pyridoxamine 5'-phosphate oxidase family protein [Weissella muntiaci]|uniref:Pyridoxamine 5'-phosphate oxidase family protein n=1 Tax=Weissella muntiaci TaxID=2508881 RepID=A0A6C2C219_9LACO|nr:pyridoxamine 5'-phosphate oxidase family protein [Weissella muntiaci]TYC47847.1 pyridoxamine 5'-phosphate oxidase family protein [Weissella muntiaci]